VFDGAKKASLCRIQFAWGIISDLHIENANHRLKFSFSTWNPTLEYDLWGATQHPILLWDGSFPAVSNQQIILSYFLKRGCKIPVAIIDPCFIYNTPIFSNIYRYVRPKVFFI
jgi:hypothetical protein